MAGSVIRKDLVIPYKHRAAKARSEAAGMISQTLPMAAMFLRNKMLSWCAFFLAVQSYLNEPINKQEEKEAANSASQPPLLRVVFSLISLMTCYIDLIFPNQMIKPAAAAVTSAAATTAAAVTGA